MDNPINAPNSETLIKIRQKDRIYVEKIAADDQFARQIEWVEKNSYKLQDYNDYDLDLKYDPKLLAGIIEND